MAQSHSNIKGCAWDLNSGLFNDKTPNHATWGSRYPILRPGPQVRGALKTVPFQLQSSGGEHPPVWWFIRELDRRAWPLLTL